MEADGGHVCSNVKRKNNRRKTWHVSLLLMWCHQTVRETRQSSLSWKGDSGYWIGDILAKNTVLKSLLQIRLQSLLDTYFLLLCFFFFLKVFTALALGGILSHCETPEGLHGWENVTRASIKTVVSRKQMKTPLWVNYSFNISTRHWFFFFVLKVFITESMRICREAPGDRRQFSLAQGCSDRISREWDRRPRHQQNPGLPLLSRS